MKTIAFLDAGQLRPNHVAKYLRLKQDHKLNWVDFIDWLEKTSGGNLLEVHYYDALPKEPSQSLQAFHNFLRDIKVHLHISSTQRRKVRTCSKCHETYYSTEQCGVDMEIVMDMMDLAPHYEQALLVTSDGDFAPVVQRFRERLARKMVVVGWKDRLSPFFKRAASEVRHLDTGAQNFITPNPTQPTRLE